MLAELIDHQFSGSTRNMAIPPPFLARAELVSRASARNSRVWTGRPPQASCQRFPLGVLVWVRSDARYSPCLLEAWKSLAVRGKGWEGLILELAWIVGDDLYV